jgi:hypothetical protein
VVETGEYTRGGHGSAADWLGSLSGSSSGAAKGRLAAAARAARDPRIDLLSGSGGFGSGGGDDEDGDDGDEGGPDRGGGQGRGRGPLARTLIIVNAESLRRGTTAGDELCEIEGIGPVSVAAATELLSEGGFQYLVKEGFDIKTVTKSTRVIANCIDMALIVRDRVCARPGCGNSLGLERDHFQLDYGHDGPTELENLVRLCPECHRLKTDGGWRLEGRPGAWKWVAPAKPPSAQQMARARKVAVAKGKAFVARAKAKDPSGPRRT